MASIRRPGRKPTIEGPSTAIGRYPGVYLGYVKDNRDVQRMGRLRVWVPEFGSDPRDETGWIYCNYASPFAGATSNRFLEDTLMEYNSTQTSYGFWGVPPDVDNEVLLTFVNGDSTRGYWFACVYNNFMNQMVPGIAASDSSLHYGPETTTDDTLLPTTEYNKRITESRKNPLKPDEEKKPINTYFAEGLLKQGLVFDEVRGLTTSSARREAPSAVVGLSTPGPVVPVDEGGPEDNIYEKKTTTESPDESPKMPTKRKGGHQFILDDHPEHEHIKLRTRGGSEVILDETNGIVYITNRDGTAWIEMSESGHVDVFSANSMSVRSQKDMNFRADRDVNIEAGRDLNMKAAKDYTNDPQAFLKGYANSEGKTVTAIFDNDSKQAYVDDFKELSQEVVKGTKSLDQAFNEALEESGFDTTSDPENLYSKNQDFPAETTLSAVSSLALIRGSHIVGEGFGDGGNVSIQGKQNVNVHSSGNSNISAIEGNVDIFASKDFNQTAGLKSNYFSGTTTTMSTGTELDISSGGETKLTSGGNFHLTNIMDTYITLRGDVYVLLEGQNLKVEAQPVKFNDTEREVDSVKHNTITNLMNYDFSAEDVKLTSTGPMHIDVTDELYIEANTIGVKTSNYNLEAAGNVEFGGTVHASGNITTEADVSTPDQSLSNLYLHVHGGVQSGGSVTAALLSASTAASSATGPNATPAQENEFYASFPNVSVWAMRANVANIASLAEVPKIYSKHNVLPMLNLNGNKEYSLNYHSQIVESISRRFITHEPCVEHENTGKVEEKDSDFAENKENYQILD